MPLPRRSSGRDVSAVRRPVLASRRLVWRDDRVAVSDMTRKVIEPVVVEPTDYTGMLKSDVVALAEARAIDSSGTKADIVARLEASDD